MAADSISDNDLAMHFRPIDLTCLSTAVEHFAALKHLLVKKQI